MATPIRRTSTSSNNFIESSDGLTITTSQAAGGGTTGDLMVYVWCSVSSVNMASNNNGYTKIFENTSEGVTVSVWTKIHDGSEGSTMNWTADTGYDDMGFISFSMYNVNGSEPISGWAFSTDAAGTAYTCPAVTQDGTSELYKVRMLACDDQAVYGDTNSFHDSIVLFADDSATGGALTVRYNGGGNSAPVDTFDIDTSTQGGGTSSAQTITLVFAGSDAYPAAVQIGDIGISMGAAF